jgi:hypothetical protein
MGHWSERSNVMGFLDRLFGRGQEAPRQPGPVPRRRDDASLSDDERAIERYRYMLRTAPPETIEQAHEEAFAQLTPAQRQQVLAQLTAAAPAAEQRTLAGAQADPRTLARAATRAEMRQPGFMERNFGGAGGGMGMGGMMAGTIFGSLVAGFVGSMVANAFFDSIAHQDTYGGDAADANAADSDVGAENAEYIDYGPGSEVDMGDDMGDFGDGGDF